MKRDNEFFRKMLLELEESDDYLLIDPLTLSSSEQEFKIHYHIQLLADAGYFTETGTGVFRMTNLGHDFLDSIRDEGIWLKTKNAVAETGGSVTLDIFGALAKGFLKEKIAKHTGIEL